MTLHELRGKLVLLDFWGYWCGPCIGAMPALMDLHDKFKDDGLFILAEHDDSVASREDYEQKLEPISRGKWSGRDLPFTVAIAGGGPTRAAPSPSTVRGATPADCGIQGWPTTLLIGPDGRVLGKFEPEGVAAQAQIERLLAAMRRP